jgi:predicted helicase
MAPYAIGHIKFSFILEEEGYRLSEDERPGFYLTNTLEMKTLETTNLPLMSALSEESHLAETVKKDTPILVILGNPPYSVSSMNKSDFIEEAMKIYKEDVKVETNIQPLSDDYIKFIRIAHWKVDQSKIGIIGIITNNSYLSGLIHRGMRKKLLESFDEIYILNLHGSARIGEKKPSGGKDENVFEITQGVSISLFVKNGENKGFGKVYYKDIFGTREEKYAYLETHSFQTTDWKELNPTEPYYFFVEKDFSMQKVYDKFVSVKKIFNKFGSGTQTHRDEFLVGFTSNEVEQKMIIFTSDLPDESVKESLNLKDTRDWKFKTAREKVKKINWRDYIRQYAYRPFDVRYICYLSALFDRGADRLDLMQNFFKENLGLITTRKVPVKFGIQGFICSHVGDKHLIADQSYLFPLYLYSSSDKKLPEQSTLHKENVEQNERIYNINDGLIKYLKETYKINITPEQIFYYIYAVLYSNIYRTKYAEFLKIDFQRFPSPQTTKSLIQWLN